MKWPLALAVLLVGGAYGWLSAAHRTPARTRVGGVVLAALVIWLAWQMR